MTFLVTVLGALVLPVLGAVATAGTRHDLHQATVTSRDLQGTFTIASPGASGTDAQSAFDGVHRALERARSSMPDALRAAVGPGEYAAVTDPLTLEPEPSKVPALVQLATDPGFAARSRIVQGRAPRASTDPTRIEVVLSKPVADAIGWPVGTARLGGTATATDPVSMRLVGLYAADDATDDAWTQTPQTLRPGVVGLGSGGVAQLGVAYTATESFGAVAGSYRATHGRAWFPLRTDTVTADTRSDLAAATRRALGRLVPLPSTVDGSTRLRTDLPDLLDASAARDATVGTLTASLGSGPLVAVIGLQALIARFTVERDRRRWELLAARGGSRALRGGLAALLVAAGSVPAAVLGAVAAVGVLVVSGTTGPALRTTVDVVAVTAVCAALPCVAAAVLVRGTGRRLPGRRVRPVVDGALAVLTVVAVVVSVRSGIGTTAPGGRVDPLAALVPVLLAASGTVAAVRLLPAVLRAVVRRTRADAGLPRFLGSVATARTPGGRDVALAVAVAGIAVALLGSVVGSTLGHGLDSAARRSVAADVAVVSDALDVDDVAALRRVQGVQAAAGVATTDSAELTTARGSVTARLIVADTTVLGRVQQGVPGALPTAPALRGGDRGGVPVLVSTSLARDIARGATVLDTRLRVVGTAPDPVPFTDATKWLLVDARHAQEITSTGSVDHVLIRTRTGADVDRVAARLRAAVSGVSVRTATEAARALASDPRVPAVRGIALVAGALGVLVGTGALAASGLLAGAARRERGRLLATLGLHRSGLRRVVWAESTPVSVAVAVTAVVVAAVAVAVLLPAADLRSFTGSPVRPPVAVDPWLLGATVLVVAAALVAVLVVETAAGTPGHRRARRRRGRNAAPVDTRPENRSRP